MNIWTDLPERRPANDFISPLLAEAGNATENDFLPNDLRPDSRAASSRVLATFAGTISALSFTEPSVFPRLMPARTSFSRRSNRVPAADSPETDLNAFVAAKACISGDTGCSEGSPSR